MSKFLRLQILTPDRMEKDAEVEFVALPAWEGEMGVLPGHAPLLALLGFGELRFRRQGRWEYFAVAGGVVRILPGEVLVFAESATTAQEIDAERARQEAARAQALLREPAVREEDWARAEAALRAALAQLKVSGMRRRRPSSN